MSQSGSVYAWGDNDHGQQGSGNTIVNKKPSLVLGLEGIPIQRVACGSSHSVAWTLPNNNNELDKKEPVKFETTKDPLGGHSLGLYQSDSETTATPILSSTKKRQSLSESILSLENFGARQAGLSHVLNAMSILQARSCVISALTSHTQIHKQREMEKTYSIEREKVPMLSPIVDDEEENNQKPSTSGHAEDTVAKGGGEAPVDPSTLTANELSETEIPNNIPNQSGAVVAASTSGVLNAYRSLTGSLSLSASVSSVNATQKHSKMSASAMSIIAATMTNQEEIINETSLTGLDDFTTLFGESEARSLIELLKLSVSGRVDYQNATETIANTLIALGSNAPSISNMLLETCITELEDICTSGHHLGRQFYFYNF